MQFGVLSPPTVSWLVNIAGRTLQDISQHDLAGRLQLAAARARWTRSSDGAFAPGRTGSIIPLDDAYWKAQAYQSRLLDATVPIYHVSGWYDDVLVGTLENFVTMTTKATEAAARGRQRLLIGPWGHGVNRSRRMGEVDFGADALIDLDGLQLRWFDRWLKGDRQRHRSRAAGAGLRDGREPVAIRRSLSADRRARRRRTTCTAAGTPTAASATVGCRPTAPAADETARSLQLRSREPGAVHHRAGLPPDWRARRLPGGRTTRRRAGLLDAAPLVEPMTMCGLLRATTLRRRLRLATPTGRSSCWTSGRTASRSGSTTASSGPASGKGNEREELLDARRGGGLRRRPVGNVSADRHRPPPAPGGVVERVPQVRSQLEHRRTARQGERGVVTAEQTVYHDRSRPSQIVVPIVPAARMP